MYKVFIILFLLFFLFSCASVLMKPGTNEEKEKTAVIEINEEEKALELYDEAVKSLESGDAFGAAKKFKEVEELMPQSKWAEKASLMASYAEYSRNSYTEAIFGLERHLKNYPADKNMPYVHYLIAICYYEQILDEKKDIQPLLKAKKKFVFLIKEYPDSDYAIDSRFKLDLITDQLAAKEMSIARFYMETKKWIPALNRLKVVVEKYDKTVFIEEALHRLVEVYYRLGLTDEAKQAASILGYNYQSGEWYKRSYKVFNKNYKNKKNEKDKDMNFIRKKLKNIFD